MVGSYSRGELAVSFTSGLHGPVIHLIISKTFEDLEVMSVVNVSLVYNFTPRCGWLETVESGTPQREYRCSLSFVLFVIRNAHIWGC